MSQNKVFATCDNFFERCRATIKEKGETFEFKQKILNNILRVLNRLKPHGFKANALYELDVLDVQNITSNREYQ